MPKAIGKPVSEARRIRAILGELVRAYPEAECELSYVTPFQLLCATILSAQCTDVRVNLVTPELFRRWPDAHALASAQIEELEEVIRSTGFYHNKAKNLCGMAKTLVEKHDGQVPRTMAQMLELPGVARKTANVVLGTAFGLTTGVVVDTHVGRLSDRLGLTTEKDPKKIERDLMAKIPREHWISFSHRMIWHGRRVCGARKPACAACRLPCPSRQAPTTS